MKIENHILLDVEQKIQRNRQEQPEIEERQKNDTVVHTSPHFRNANRETFFCPLTN